MAEVMSISLANSIRGRSARQSHRILLLTVLFWLFSYAFLAMRGAMLEEQWGALLSLRRAITVTFGAGAFWLVLKRLETIERVDLGKAVGWIVIGTLAVMIVRLSIEQLLASDPLPPLRTVRWTLAWSGYFGLWVMGALAFHKGVAQVRPSASPMAVRAPAAVRDAAPKDRISASDLEWIVNAIGPEIADLRTSDRLEAARRIRALGGYELADDGDPWAKQHNARLKLANRIADRLLQGARS